MSWRAAIVWAGVGLLSCGLLSDQGVHRSQLQAQEQGSDESKRELEQQRKIIDRFLSVLEKNPRRGTALDRIYGFHVEWGTLDEFVDQYRKRVEKNKDDGPAWMVLGLVEAQRGRDAAAVEAFTAAEQAQPESAMASYYLGQSLVLVGQPEKAAEAFERAIERKPPQADLLDIFQALGRVYQRAQKNEEALAVWTRLEKLFPNDARVQEQIAATLVEEGQAEQALPRYEALVKLTKEDYRRAVYRMEAAELKVKLKQPTEAIADLEAMLAGLNPESWLHREVRRRIEEVFLRSDDQDGLAKYYERWIEKNPEDVDAMARLARSLARQARVPEAQTWLEKALKLAPTRKELRLAFIDQLVDDQRYADAIKQYELLEKNEPNNPDYLREWGKLVLKDSSQPIEDRRKKAEAVWRRLTAARPEDPLLATQAADLFRHAEMTDQALELYQKAVELAPDQPQYREYLGEYYHLLKQPEKAMTTWRAIATGKQRTAANVARLAEVLAGFGYLDDATTEIAAACQLDPKDFGLFLKAGTLHLKAEKYDEALSFLAGAEKLAASNDEAEAVLAEEIKVLQANGTLEARAETLAGELSKSEKPAVKEWVRLARYYESMHRYDEAIRAIASATKLEPQSIAALAASARIHEQSGNLREAAELNRRLAATDRRFRTDYLTNVARLEAQLGRIDEALAAGRDLIAAAPGNSEHYEFFAELCFRLGRSDEGLEALRRAIRVNPTETKLLLALAQALSEQFRTDEAIELYWQSFAKSPGIDEKINVVTKLAELHLQTNHFEQLIDRLERDRRDAEQRRELTICLAQAHHTAGDYGTARQELEGLLSEDTRDTQLLQQLSKLAETEQDLATAIKYQEQLVKVAPGPETEYRLATLLSRDGKHDEASAIFTRLAAKEEDPEKLLRSLDSILASGQAETVLAITEPRLREEPRNWELLYREGAVLAPAKPQEAAQRFEKILELTLSDDEIGVAAKARERAAQRSAASAAGGSSSATARRVQPSALELAMRRFDAVYQIKSITGLNPERYYGMPGQTTVWTPQTYGQARMAALGWLLAFAEKENRRDEFVATYEKAGQSPQGNERALWDLLYVQQLRSDNIEYFETAKALAKTGSLTGQALLLNALPSRASQQGVVVSRGRQGQGQVDNAPPLSHEDLELVLAAYRNVSKHLGDDPMARTRRTYFVNTVCTELKRAKRHEEEEALYREAIKEASDDESIGVAFNIAIARGDLPTVFELFDKWARLQLDQSAKRRTAQGQYLSGSMYELAQLIGRQGEARKHDDVLALLDRYLDFQIANSKQTRAAAARRPARNRQAQARSTNYINVWYGNSQSGVQLDYPQPNQFLDYAAIVMLRNAFEVYRRNDLTSDLVAHCNNRRAKAAAADKIYHRLITAYVNWWNDDRSQALALIKEASDEMPQEVELRMELARLHELMQQYDEALAVADSIRPLDHNTLEEKETFCLNLAVRLGDIERARQAAERLFGLRLDAETQAQLASQMRRLGMTAMAENVLARAQRQAGNRMTALVTLMNQHQAEGRPDVASQIAFQILRRTPGNAGRTRRMGYYTQDDMSRQAALSCLAQSGKLKELIARTEEQLKSSPQSAQLYQTLAEYYQTAGDRTKSVEVLGKIVELRSEDATLRFQYAQMLSQAGKAAEACEEYKKAIKKQPNLFGNRYWEVQNAFQQANKAHELAALLEEIDIRQLGQYYSVMNIAQQMLSNDNQRDAGLRLFKKAWEAFPQQRAWIVGSIYDDATWKLPELYEYGKQALLPSGAVVQHDPWQGLNQINSWENEGRINGVVSRVVEGAAANNQLETLRNEVSEAINKQPTWIAGKLLLAMLHARLGENDEARKLVEELLAADPPISIPSTPRWFVAQEFEAIDELRPLAIRLYEGASDDNTNQNQFRLTPASRLAKLYRDAGRKEGARELMLKAAQRRLGNEYDAEYAAYQRMENSLEIAKELDELGYPIDAIRMYRAVLADPGAGTASRWRGNQDYYLKEAGTRLQTAVQRVTATTLGDSIQELLAPKQQPDGASAVDLMITVPKGELGQSRMQSLLTDLLEHSLKPEARSQVRGKIDELIARHPDDLGLHVAAVFAVAGKEEPAREEALKRLHQVVEKTPLEELAEGKRPNARQRAEAERQMAVWLAARECLASERLRPVARQLAERAIAAADRQIDAQYARSMLFEWGQIAARNGDKQQAEEAWSRLLDKVLARPKAKRADAAAVPAERQEEKAIRPSATRLKSGATAPKRQTPFRLMRLQVAVDAPDPFAPRSKAAPGPVPRAAVRPKGSEAGIPPLTISQFKAATEIAKAAAEHDMRELSLRALGEALSGGLPVDDPQPIDPNARQRGAVLYVGGGGMVAEGNDANSRMMQQVVPQVRTVLSLWEQREFPPADVYQLLKKAVFPANRPDEILLYELQIQDHRDPQSIGRLLAEWCARAKQSDDLRQAVAARESKPLARLPGRVLLAQLGLAERDGKLLEESLGRIADELKQSTTQAQVELACHAALPAFEHDAYAEAALPVLEVAMARVTSMPDRSQATPLAMKLARHHFQRGDEENGKKRLDDYLKARQPIYARYSGDSGIYMQRQDVAQVSAEAARAGLLPLALEYLGRVADLPSNRDHEPALQIPLWHLERELARRSPQEGYELLRDWTLPNKSRASVRLIAAFRPSAMMPEHFLSEQRGNANDAITGAEESRNGAVAAFGSTEAEASDSVVLSNLGLLIEAARRAGKLDELATAAEKAADDKASDADVLLLNVQLAQKDLAAAATAGLRKMTDESRSHWRNPNPQRGSNRIRWRDFLTMAAAREVPERYATSEEFAHNLIQQARGINSWEFMTGSRFEWARGEIARAGANISVAQDPGLKWWFPATPAGVSHSHLPPMWWLANGEYIGHLGGFEHDLLYFAYPLAGDFEFSAECFSGGWAESDMGYGGIVVESLVVGFDVLVWPIGFADQVRRPNPVEREEAFNRVTMKVTNASMRYYVNDHLVYEDKESSPTAPWLYLYAHLPRHTAFRNLRLTGNPIIPREVPLTYGDRLEGWISTYYNERQPPRRSRLDRADGPDAASASSVVSDTETAAGSDWESKGGVIQGRYDPSASAERAQSVLVYHRPLRNGDRVSYQFLYEPGRTHTHPSLGRLAFLLEPEGVRVHWLTRQNAQDELVNFGPRNVFEEPEHRRGPKELPLRPGEWNDLELAVNDNTMTLVLNGETIYERPLEATNDRRFGLFHYKDETAVQVRNAVLRGNWPERIAIEELGNLAALNDEEKVSPAEWRARHALIGEQLIVFEAFDIWKRASEVDDASAYALLRDWVLPNERRWTFRPQGDFAPVRPPLLAGSDSGARQGSEVSGQFVAPVVLLSQVASKLGKLDELKQEVEALPTQTPYEARAKLAIQIVLSVASGNDGDAKRQLAELRKLAEAMSLDAWNFQRWPEVTAEIVAAERPALVDAARHLADYIAEQQQKQYVDPRWEKLVRHVRGYTHYHSDAKAAEQPFGTPPRLTQWSLVRSATAEDRGTGYPANAWSYQRGEVTHYPALQNSALYFNVPLRGNFEVECYRSTYGWREIYLAYAGFGIDPRGGQGDSYGRYPIGRPESLHSIAPRIPKWGEWCDYRLVVKDGTYSASANGRQFFSEKLPANPDPWLLIHTTQPHFSGTMKNVRITGSPTVPEMLNLSEASTLVGWRADAYKDTIDGKDNLWVKQGDEIVGNLFKNAPESYRESVLQYHRPMLEDGEIEYEFYFAPGKTEIHPALDRVAFLLKPDGATLHAMTDGAFERNGLAPENESRLPEGGLLVDKLPLKADAWNRLRLELKGDVVTLVLNETPVVRSTLAPDNDRTFGLFRYSDGTAARVRNVTYRGDWPRVLPTVEEQELALPKQPAVQIQRGAAKAR